MRRGEAVNDRLDAIRARHDGTAHRMIAGSHERASGPECRCGAAWGWIAGKCQRAEVDFQSNAPADIAFLLAELDAAQAAKAEAWERGWTAGYGLERGFGTLDNPYRQEATDAG